MPLLSGFTGPQGRDDVHDHGTIDPTLLDSLGEDLGRKGTRFQPVSQMGRLMSAVLLVRSPVGVSRKTLPMMKFPNGVYCPFQAQAVPAPHVVDCDRVADHVEHQGRKRLRLIRHSQCETVAVSSPTGRQFSRRCPGSVRATGQRKHTPISASCKDGRHIVGRKA